MSLRVILPLVFIFLAGCETTMPSDLNITPDSIWSSGLPSTPLPVAVTPTLSYQPPHVYQDGDPVVLPTPDEPHYQPLISPGGGEYIVQRGDILGAIAQEYGVSIESIVEANDIHDPDRLEVGQTLIIPAVELMPMGSDNKIIPDSEFVYGPLSATYDIESYIRTSNGYLASFSMEVDGERMSGTEIILRIARNYSINPRLLLALLEYQSGWLTNPNPVESYNPFGYIDDWYSGLYRQLAWASVHLNAGYYGWSARSIRNWQCHDGSVVPVAPTINSGTAGVQNLLAQLDDYDRWLFDTSPAGFYRAYNELYGNPFFSAIEPLVPEQLVQPYLQLPFGSGEIWSFTGGPHLAWDAGTPFGGLDFAPPGEALGCVEVEYWVVALADGLVIRTGNGLVVLDLDLDGNEGSGWVIIYMHIESRDRVLPGTFLRAGDYVGHPSCEGGVSSGTHVHLARKFNGVWIAADGPHPFILDGWVSGGSGEEYVGTLSRAGVVVESYEGTSQINQIQR